MPIYEFQCETCQHLFEYLCFSQREADELKCPNCQGKEITQLMSMFGGKIGNASVGGCGPCKATTCPPS